MFVVLTRANPMFQGELLGIFIADHKGEDLHSVAEIEAAAGQGLVGDRYCVREGQNKPSREVTLIEVEALDALARDYQLTLPPERSRRNLLTRRVPLNHLVGQTFRVGAALLHGVELCEPCGHLEKLVFPGLRKGLAHRGGLRAQVLEGGTLRVGDPIQLTQKEPRTQ